MVDVRVLSTPGATLRALQEICEWASSIELAYAWITSSGGDAEHWKALPLDKVRRAIIGLHFAQTEPHALNELWSTGTLRVVLDTQGVFHPKVLIGVRDDEARAIVGSSNFTVGGFDGNTELNVLIQGKIGETGIRELNRFVERQWEGPRSEELTEEAFARYCALYEKRPKPPKLLGRTKRSPVVRDRSDLDVDWPRFCELIAAQERRMLHAGWEIRVFDHERGSYLQEAERCQQAFANEPEYARMSLEDRKLVAGWGKRTSGYFGMLGGAGRFMRLTKDHPELVGEHLDQVPLNGPVGVAAAERFIREVRKNPGVGLGAATRLLAVKRPDQFLAVNNGNYPSIQRVFGIKPDRLDKYLSLLEWLRDRQWFEASEPQNEDQRRVWRARMALVDAIFYEHPA